MSVDLTIAGDHAAVRRLADWLAPDLDDPLANADVDLAYLRSDSEYYWSGQSGDAFRGAVGSIRDGSSPLARYLQDAAEVFRAYANRLERGQEDFGDYLVQAADAGLTVAGKVVMVPTSTLTYCPTEDAPEEDVTEWNRYLGKMSTYRQLSTQVGTWWGDLEAWIAENLAPLTARVNDLGPIGDVLTGLSVGNEDVVGTALEFADARVDRDLTDYRAAAERWQVDADTFSDDLRSGNPALKAAAIEANPREMRAGLRALNEAIGEVTRYSKVIPIVGGVVDVVAAGVDIANGESPSSVGAGLLGGIGGAALGGAGIAGLAAFGIAVPPVGVALVVGSAAVAAGAGAQWLWEAAVPLDARETIDDFFTGSPPQLVNESTDFWAVGTR